MQKRPSGHLFARIAQGIPEPDHAAVNRAVYSPEEVCAHAKDNWVIYGKTVYNLTRYVEYHPGGKACLNLGGDITHACYAEHPWVNVEVMIRKLAIGRVVGCSLQPIAEE